MKQLIIFIFVLMAVSLGVLAVDVTLPQTDFVHGDQVVTSVSCAGDAVLRIQNPEGQLIYVDQGRGVWESSYHTNSDSSRGQYSIRVACEDATSAEQSFCVDAPGCTGGANINNDPVPPADIVAPSRGGSGGDGRARCRAQWDCEVWTFCNATRQQSRPCTDVNNCEKPKAEVRECVPCRESWACSSWSECDNGAQSRNCVDDYDCGTEQYKPLMSKGCDDVVTGPEPARLSSQIPPPKYSTSASKTVTPVADVELTIWEQYKLFILAGIVLLLAVIVLAVFFLLRGKKHVVYNHDELKDWITKEKAAGTTEIDIRQILMQQTGWTKEDVDKAFAELNENSSSSAAKPTGAGK